MGTRNIVAETADALAVMAKTYAGALVSFSGGKDSLAILDLVCRAFPRPEKRVVAFFMFTVPGLAVQEERLDFARQRYGVEVLRYPHWGSARAMKWGVYCPGSLALRKLPDYRLRDVYALARADSGLRLIVSGIKKADSEFRRKNLNAFARDEVFCPLKDWNKLEVLAYLSHHKIVMPSTSIPAEIGIDLSAPSLLWLHDNHPDDFKKVLEWFPYADAVVARRNFFGIDGTKRKAKRG